jgi:hypothetical protein
MGSGLRDMIFDYDASNANSPLLYAMVALRETAGVALAMRVLTDVRPSE